MRRGGVAILLAMVLASCAPIAGPMPADAEPAPIGPEIVIDVWNRSDRDVIVAYEFSAPNAGGGGEGTVAGCERTTMPFGAVAGQWEIIVDGLPAFEGDVPPGMPVRGALVAQVLIGPGGDVTLEGDPAWRPVAPPAASRPIPCG